VACSRLSGHIRYPSVFILHYNRHELVRPLSTVDNTRDYARVSHSRQWSNYNIYYKVQWVICARGAHRKCFT